TTNVDLTIKNEYQIQLQFDTHLGLHFHFLYSKTELLIIKRVSFGYRNYDNLRNRIIITSRLFASTTKKEIKQPKVA
ncbi:hypothetical protein DT248_05140, partial [Staphylococcus haemolyticus]